MGDNSCGYRFIFFAIFDGSTKNMGEPGWYIVLHVTCNSQTSLPLDFKSHRSAVRTKQSDQSRAPNRLSGHCRMRYYHYLATFIPSGHPAMHVIRWYIFDSLWGLINGRMSLIIAALCFVMGLIDNSLPRTQHCMSHVRWRLIYILFCKRQINCNAQIQSTGAGRRTSVLKNGLVPHTRRFRLFQQQRSVSGP